MSPAVQSQTEFAIMEPSAWNLTMGGKGMYLPTNVHAVQPCMDSQEDQLSCFPAPQFCVPQPAFAPGAVPQQFVGINGGYVCNTPLFYMGANGLLLPLQQQAGFARVEDSMQQMHGMNPMGMCSYPLEPSLNPSSATSNMPHWHGNVWRMSKDKDGCRLIQEVLEEATSDGDRLQVACELRTHVWEALRDPNANHVVQKCISTMRPLDKQFIVDEILERGHGAVLKVARHQYGCRVLQRLLEHGNADKIVEELLAGAVEICTHMYAQFVLQHLCEHGTTQQVNILTELLADNIAAAGAHSYGCAVLNKAFDHSGPEARTCLAHALLKQPDLLLGMSSSRYGHVTVHTALQAAETPQRAEALSKLMAQQDKLTRSRYGRVLNKQLEKFLHNN